MKVIEIKNVYKSYFIEKRDLLFGKNISPSRWTIEDLSLDIYKGETIGILGVNGAGKSTLLKMIAKIAHPLKGEIKVHGKLTSLLELGAGLNPNYTAIENIYFYYQIVEQRNPSKEEIQEILDFSELEEFKEMTVGHYSSGMFVRLAFALATSIQPDILIVDEALSVGDISFQMKCNRRIQQFQEEGRTILFVSHSLDQIFKLCSKVLLLQRGRKIYFGDTYQAINIYKRTVFSTDYEWKNEDNVLEYGNKDIEITNYEIRNEEGIQKNEFIQGEKIYLYLDFFIHRKVESPIFAFTLKDLYGQEITGSNTLYENTLLPPLEVGKGYSLSFEWILNLRPQGYTVSLGITQIDKNGLSVLHRLYDTIQFKIISQKEFVGIFDPRATISIRECTP